MKKIDIFISHAFRFHDSWNRVVEWIDMIDGLEWRNFSVPWHDPALRVSSPIGEKLIRETIITQVIPSDICIVILSLKIRENSRIWVDLAETAAIENNIPIFYLDDLQGSEPGLVSGEIYNFEFDSISKLVLEYAK